MLPAVLSFPQAPEPELPPATDVDLPDTQTETTNGNVTSIEVGDGSVIIDLNPQARQSETNSRFDANLALEMDEAELTAISAELIRGIEDDQSNRRELLDNLARGMKLLGFTVESEGSAAASAPLEGMSTVIHPLLADACITFNATAIGELLPASGPVKIRDDLPRPPQGVDGTPEISNPAAVPGVTAPATDSRDDLADALETDFNHYLTGTAAEYYPDTDQMLFRVGFGGWGIKKVYNCPLRRRPVSESVNIEDFIVSNTATDLANAGRKTHRIKMRPSVLKRMQALNVYRSVPVGTPTQADQNNSGIDQAKAEISGVQPQVQDPKDADYELYEVYTDLQLDRFAPKKLRNKELSFPYRVTIEKDSQKILEIRRNWDENDEQAREVEYFVEFPFLKAFGFYGVGLLHILGNTASALTKIWRQFIDNGSFANFPGFVFAKGAGRQLSNQFRVAPGSGVGLDVGLQKLSDAVMPLPYRDLGPQFAAFVTHVEQLGQKLGGTANIAVGEGRQDAPVGTTLALIEQATKPTGAVMKRLHSAQAKEINLLKKRFKKDPEAFWRFNPKPAMQWQRAQFLKALEDYDLVPVSDPNNPTHLHRASKAEWLKQTAIQAPMLLDAKKVFLRAAHNMQISDAEDLLAAPQPQQAPPVDPKAIASMHKTQTDAQVKGLEIQSDFAQAKMEQDAKMQELAQRERLALIEQQTERMRLAGTLAIHTSGQEAADRTLNMKLASTHALDTAGRLHDMHMQQNEADQQPPPVPEGARLAPHGHHYIPDESRPGKYLRVVH